MKLNDLIIEKKSSGIFVDVEVSNKSKDDLMNLIKELKIPNPTKRNKIHCTVMYSYSDASEFMAEGERTREIDPPIIAKPKKFEIFKSNDDENCLVILLNCPELVKRHKQLVKDYDLVYTYDEFIPHITLSYDCGDFNTDDKEVKDYINNIEFINERKDYLDDDWSN